MISSEETEIQQNYYAKTASQYDCMHIDSDEEHIFALHFLCSVIDHLNIESILDIGSGTGRVIQHIKKIRPNVRIVGIEPVKELREIGYSKGLSDKDLIDGDANKLNFEDNSFDLVCEFGVLHHIKHPQYAVAEMLRTSQKAIFISDSNNFGQGSRLSRFIKQIFNSVGLWKFADFVKTKGKGYTISDGDGLGYSYSVFNNYKQIQKKCRSIHLLNTKDGGINLYRSSSHIVLLGMKK